MKTGKRVLACVMAAAMMSSMAACGSKDTGAGTAKEPEKTTAAETTEAAKTETSAQETEAAKGDDMTLEELIEAAQNEATADGAGTFMVYAPTSRISKALAAFTEEYGIQGEYYNESGQDLYTKLTTELEANTKDTADVVLMQDSYLFQTQLVDYDYVTNYVPPYLKDSIIAEDQAPLICYYYNKLFIYNNTDGSKGISNIWELTEDSFKGKLFMKDISKESVNKNFLAMLTSDDWSAKIETAYKDFYGKEIELDEDCPNAGYQFIKQMLANVKFGSGDGDIATELADGLGGNMGLFVYSKLRDDSVAQDNLSVAAYAEKQPEGFSGFMYPMYLQMVTNTDRPYTSKLFIYFLMTEDGFKSAFQTKDSDIGTYSTNATIKPLEGDKELVFWKDCLVIEDPTYLPKAYADGILDFITYCTQ
ncbi:peptide ABC transporter ATP-binding protein [Clostridium sp. chh4-2]|uniref:extracellular solute-binding protein n=1 Tax=Clostridium sp. chh4-2 TaxID=2067550 RepID=UPI000CCE17D1|nr:extracellular solute-binding protein [Clostridium sp. chh4-2]PNV59446.1 peptide ABC transporter ATP-binding protein [Clostridium sp. chh4-2]